MTIARKRISQDKETEEKKNECERILGVSRSSNELLNASVIGGFQCSCDFQETFLSLWFLFSSFPIRFDNDGNRLEERKKNSPVTAISCNWTQVKRECDATYNMNVCSVVVCSTLFVNILLLHLFPHALASLFYFSIIKIILDATETLQSVQVVCC